MRWFSLVLAMLLVVIIVLFLGLRTDFFAREASRLAMKHFLDGTPFSISIEKLEGSIVNDVTVKGVRIRYRGPDGSFDILRADEISCRYDLLSLLGRDPVIEDLSVTKPVVRLKADSAGVFILPSFGKGKGGFPAFVIERCSIEDGHVFVEGLEKADAVSGINLVGSLRSGGKDLEMRISQGVAAAADRNFVLRSLKGRIVLRMGEAAARQAEATAARISFDSLAVVLDESAFTASGMVVPSTRLFDINVVAEPVSIGEITRMLRIETSHSGEIKGTFRARGTPDLFRLTGTVNGVLSGYALRDFGFDLHRDADVVRLDSLAGTFNGAYIHGTGSYSLEAPNDLRVACDVRDLDLSQGFAPGRELPETRLNGAIDLRYRVDDGSIVYACDLGKGDFMKFPFESAVTRGTYANDVLDAEDIRLFAPTHTVTGRGRIIGDDSLSFVFNLDCQASDTIFGYLDVTDYRGDLSANGMWEGTFDAWDVHLSGTCANLAYRQAFVPEGEIKLAVKRVEDDDYRVSFDLEGPGCRIGRAHFSKVSLSLAYADSVTVIKKLSLARDTLTADMAIDVRLERAGTAIRFRELFLNAFGDTWTGGGEFSVFIGDTVARFEDIQLHSRSGAVFVDGRYDMERKTLDGGISFERVALDLANRAKLLGTPLAGKVRGSIRLTGAAADPDLAVDIAVGGARVDTIDVDSLRASVRYAQGRWSIDSLRAASPSGAVDLRGELSGASLADLRRGSREALDRSIVSLEASTNNLNMIPFLALTGVTAFSDGKLSGGISITDSLAHPLIAFKGTIRDLSVSAVRVPSIECDLTVDREKLSVDGVLRVSPQHEGAFHGTLPLVRARFLYGLDRVKPVSFEVDLPEGDLAGLADATDIVADAAGRYSAQLMVTGSIVEPHLYGDFRMSEASFRLSGMEERYYGVNAIVLLEDSLITISKLSAREGKKGTLNCAGRITLRGWRPAAYDLTATADKFVLASLSNILAIVSGTLKVATKTEGGRSVPVLSGTFEVKESEVYYDLGSLSSTEGGSTLEPPSYEAAIDLTIPGNTWIKTPDARIELQGDVTLYHDARGTYFRGELTIVRGWYNVYNNKFNITSGSFQFVHAGSFRPVVDIEAETKDADGRTIYLTLAWHQDDVEPRLTLTHEDSGYSETDIWKMLGGGVVRTSESDATSWDARGTAQGIAANYLESVLNSQMEGIVIELETGTGSDPLSSSGDFQATQVAIGKYLSQGLYVKYKQGLSISTAREIEVEYRISRLFLIRSEIIRYSEKVLQGKSTHSADEINVDVKLRWEF